MKSVPLAACAALLASCASAGLPDVRHPSKTGCESFPIGETVLWWQDAPLSSASFRFAVDPDTGQGPTTLVVLDSGKMVNLGNPDNSPIFLAAIGDAKRTCVVQMPLRDCPAASVAYERLKGASIPLGFGMEDPADIFVFHAPTYYLEFSDGQANHNQWRFYGMDHPLQRVIDESIESLESCIAPALAAYEGR
ncbi:MAG: hypothetical protein K0M70_08175 [Arenimonas sp.]|uniref:hypothetical protein n=1 Tax=Arenimonas sp. TaxID=1872635 RepID=UPI0025C69B75|nr:hypothetical protein [Arenimonas sp.]MBW8367818.1 hypothetical protein [Arenimonas sp.]